MLDPTIAIKKGDDTSIPAYQTVNREIELDNFQKIKEIKVDLIFHYWLPFEKEYQIQSGIKTLINYSLLPEVNIATIVKTLFKKNIWEVLGELKDIKPKPIYLIDSKLILVNRTL